jgi:putative GTP pyrophosphokinase
MTELRKTAFLREYKLERDFYDSGYDWHDIELIEAKYESINDDLDKIAKLFENSLLEQLKQAKIPGFYYRYRVKDVKHLIEKIIRNSKKFKVTSQTFFHYIDDLIGFRIIHSFKSDWVRIHEIIVEFFSKNSQELNEFILSKEKPKLYHRFGDSSDWLGKYKTHFEEDEHERSYRSTHYSISYVDYKIELQVRTIFEEAWCEVDHTIVYPYQVNNLLLRQFSDLLNRISGSGDEIVSYFEKLNEFLKIYEVEKKVTKINLKHMHLLIKDTSYGDHEKLEKILELLSDFDNKNVNQIPFSSI